MYEIHEHNRTCKKKPLKADFQPMAIPKDATLVGQLVLGSSSGPGEGLLVNSWTGDLPDKTGVRTFHSFYSLIHLFFFYKHVLFCLFRKVCEHGHWVWLHSRQHSLPDWSVWMGGDQVSFSPWTSLEHACTLTCFLCYCFCSVHQLFRQRQGDYRPQSTQPTRLLQWCRDEGQWRGANRLPQSVSDQKIKIVRISRALPRKTAIIVI